MLTEDEIKDRVNYLGGSDMAVIMGLSNYKTPYMLFLEKRGLIIPDIEETERQYWGKMLEPVIKAHFERSHNVVVSECNAKVHPHYPFIRGNLDGFVYSTNTVWEAKCSDAFMRHMWGEDGSDEIPMEYLVQIATYCSIMNSNMAYLSVLIGGNEHREYVYNRNLELESIILKTASNFWNCVQNNIEPENLNLDDLKFKYKKSTQDKQITINKDVGEQLRRLSEINSKIKELTELQNQSKCNIMKFMEDSECLTDESGKPLITWRQNAKGSRTFLFKGV